MGNRIEELKNMTLETLSQTMERLDGQNFKEDGERKYIQALVKEIAKRIERTKHN